MKKAILIEIKFLNNTQKELESNLDFVNPNDSMK
jgi:hypothetical protein